MEQSNVLTQIQELEKQLAELKKESQDVNPIKTTPAGVHPLEKAMEDTPSADLGQKTRSGDTVKSKSNEGDEEENYIPIGETGVFDGEFVIMSNDKKYQVPPNYASKSRLVVGDKLQLVSHGDMNSFKIMEQVSRKELTGILTKSDNQWVVFVDETNYLVIAASIRYYEGEIGDKVVIQVPETPVMEVKWAAVKSVIKEGVAVDPEKRRAERVIAQAKEAEESKPRVSMYGGKIIETPVPPDPRKPMAPVKPRMDDEPIEDKKVEEQSVETFTPEVQVKPVLSPAVTKRDIIVEYAPKTPEVPSLPESGEVMPKEDPKEEQQINGSINLPIEPMVTTDELEDLR
ncbi:hypothetical protein GW793_02825 [bacterium]|uniref:50S ribosomal protein L7/L12 n=2 Tax=Katanobacteria TaxID=422282 RepID=A0A2M7X229_UNCKA|nr:hypothetical protein [bacterium]PIP56955.1 MAG: hypothetical protein COX05_00240 [candidate division WWE3 bacterium CG22_combo_CG10-13_8_21_14_all_39_12]PJA40225.1 MAG: hypothetical protein CO179_02850 [candidate division WWE3 bacterium CG_4_9_14_3_um_filter_39_7]